MTKPRATSTKGKGKGKGKSADATVTALPLPSPPRPAEQTIQLPETLRWKSKAFQEGADRAQANVKAAHSELLLRQAEMQKARQDLQDVVSEMTAALQASVPPGYTLAEVNPTDGIALCRLAPEG